MIPLLVFLGLLIFIVCVIGFVDHAINGSWIIIGKYWGNINTVKSIGDIELAGSSKSTHVCFTIAYNKKQREYKIQSVQDKEGIDIGKMSTDRAMYRFIEVLKKDGIDTDEYLENLRKKKFDK